MKRVFKTIDEYIESCPKEVQSILTKMRRTIRKAAPKATEAISYQIPTFKLDGKNLVHFAAFKAHIGFYPTSSGIEAFKKEISQYKWSRGAVQFPLGKPIPWELVARVVAYRVSESGAKSSRTRTA